MTGRVVCAPAALKGVLSASEAAAALAAGARAAGAPADEVPVADGGDGTAEALERALGGDWVDTVVSDPLGRPTGARLLFLPNGAAVVEAAEAIGLAKLEAGELDPFRASSRGLGELIVEAARGKPSALLVGLGGTATVDGGAGLREVLDRLPLPVEALCDVRNPLLGERGAARAFGPQKGASRADVEELEARLSAMAELRPFAQAAGAGAAGGLGAALAALGATLVPGARRILDLIGFRKRLRGAGLVVTGEGTVDSTTLEGKAPGEVLAAAFEEGVPAVLFGGRVLERPPRTSVRVLSGRPAAARDDLVALGKELGGALVTDAATLG